MTSSVSFKKALLFSLLFHICLLTVLVCLERPSKPNFQIVHLRLKTVSYLPSSPINTSKSLPSSQSSLKSFSPKIKRPQAPAKRTSPVKKKPTKKISKKSLKSSRKGLPTKRKISPSRSSLPKRKPISQEENLLAKRLAALKAAAEERALRERLAKLKNSQTANSSAGLSLGTGLSEDFARKLMAHLKSFWAVPEVLEGRKELWAEVELKIAPDGHLLSYRFLHRSGEPLFDEAVVATLKKAEPLPAPGKILTLSAIFKIR